MKALKISHCNCGPANFSYCLKFFLIYFEGILLSAGKCTISSWWLIPLICIPSSYLTFFALNFICIYVAFFLLVFAWYVSFHPDTSTFFDQFLVVYILRGCKLLCTCSIFQLLNSLVFSFPHKFKTS